jgi:predicted amidophosphoribosyltransferase
MRQQCEGCGAPLAETGPPIWETYCTDRDCKHDWEEMVRLMALSMIEQERREYERLKAKFDPPT